MDRIMKRSKLESGVQIGNVNVSEMLFADDVAYISDTLEKLQDQIERFNRECAEAGMTISKSKSEVMLVSRNQRNIEIRIEGQTLKQVNKFRYLECLINNEEKLDDEISQRIGSADRILKLINSTIITKRELSLKAKVSVYNSVYVPTLIYGNESWTLNKRMESRVQACEMRYLRKIVGKRRIDKIRNDVIRNQIGVEKLGDKIERSQLRWYGHVQRMPDNRLPKQELNSGTQNMAVRPRRRPRIRWTDKMT